jgi:hypothetical protein
VLRRDREILVSGLQQRVLDELQHFLDLASPRSETGHLGWIISIVADALTIAAWVFALARSKGPARPLETPFCALRLPSIPRLPPQASSPASLAKP